MRHSTPITLRAIMSRRLKLFVRIRTTESCHRRDSSERYNNVHRREAPAVRYRKRTRLVCGAVSFFFFLSLMIIILSPNQFLFLYCIGWTTFRVCMIFCRFVRGTQRRPKQSPNQPKYLWITQYLNPFPLGWFSNALFLLFVTFI